MAKALYRKYRSRSLSEVVGQAHVTDILARSLAAGHIAHAYLLTGPRGVGKTSIARILAHEINKLPYREDGSHLDIIEIDAASNNGVEDVRDLRDKVQIAPVSSAKKIYIIDEVHMLSKAAFNALLKTLEEPPEHVVFILATTDADKLPDTIISRTQRFTFRTIAPEAVAAHLKEIADKEKITIDDEALALIAQRGEGSFRDSISLLDQLRSLTDDKQGITRELVEQSLGLAPAEHVTRILEAYEAKDLAKIVELLHESTSSHIPAELLAGQLTQVIREQIINKPQLIDLLDKLLEVPKSSQPSLKLLTVLAAHAKPQSKSAALSAPMPEVKATVEELSNPRSPLPSSPLRDGFALGLKSGPDVASDLGLQISRSDDEGAARHQQSDALPDSSSVDPSATTASSSLSNNSVREQRVTARGAAPKNVLSKGQKFLGADAPAGPASVDGSLRGEGEQEITTKERTKPLTLDWQKLIDYTREHFVAVYSVLSKCSYETKGETLVIYTGNAFYKKKLDESARRVNLMKSLAAVDAGEPQIETIPTAPPPKDSQAAAVAAIMGGGEEVTVDAS